MAQRGRYAANTQKVKNYSPTKPDWDSDTVLDEACQQPNDKPMHVVKGLYKEAHPQEELWTR